MRGLIDINKCDVQDVESLALFRKAAQRWHSLLVSDDRNSIQNQLTSIRNDFARFKLFVHGLSNSQPKFHTEAGYDNSIVELFIRCFFDSHLMAMRRISDNADFNPKRKVISLPTLLEEVDDNLQYLTRENYVCYDGTPYAEDDEMLGTIVQRLRGRHWQFDILCGSSVRDRKDRIAKEIIERLAKKIEGLGKVRDYVNKFLAHASDPGNRSSDLRVYNIPMQKMEEYIELVCEIAHGIGKICGYTIHSHIANPGIEILEGWTDRLLQEENVADTYEHWRGLVSDADIRSREMNAAEHKNWG